MVVDKYVGRCLDVGSTPTGSIIPLHSFAFLGKTLLNGSLSTVVGWEKLRSRKDKFRPFFFDVQSNKNPFFEVFKVSKSKGIALDESDEIISRF